MEGDDNPTDLYRECLRNHAASLGSYATDGCREFTLDDTSPSLANLQCAACGCHRNFHRKVTFISSRGGSSGSRRLDPMSADLLEYGRASGRDLMETTSQDTADRGGKKRFRTKFSPDQKTKMLEFAEKLGWKLQRRDRDDEIDRFCRGVGISRQVFKVWMHNHKNSFSSSSASTGNASSLTQETGS